MDDAVGTAAAPEWDGYPPDEHAGAHSHLLSDRGAPPCPARFDPDVGVWWVKPGVPFPIHDMASCGFRYLGPVVP